MAANIIQKITEDTCNGLIISNERYFFKKPGTRYCNAPVRPNNIPVAINKSPVIINSLEVVSLLLFNGAVIVKCKSFWVRSTGSIHIFKEGG